MKRRSLLQATPALLTPALVGLPAWAQAPFPNKPIRYIVGPAKSSCRTINRMTG